MAECDANGPLQKDQDDMQQPRGQSYPTCFRVYINNIPNSMNEEEVFSLVTALTDVAPKFKRLSLSNRPCFEDQDPNNRKYFLIEFDTEKPAMVVAEGLHNQPPHFFDVRVSNKPRVPYNHHHGNFQQGNFRRQNFHQQGGYQRRGTQIFTRGNHHNNGGRNQPESPGERQPGWQAPVEFRVLTNFNGQRPMYPKTNQGDHGPLLSSPPTALAAPGEFCSAPLMLMGGEQYCYGCGSMTQSNCATCFTPFCSTFCLGKLNNPSHPYECNSMLSTSSPQMVTGQPPSFVWMQQNPPPNENKKKHQKAGRGKFLRDNNNQGDAPVANGSEPCTPEEGVKQLEEGLEQMKLTKPPPSPPKPVAANTPTPPLQLEPKFSTPPPRVEGPKTPEVGVAVNGYFSKTPRVENYRATPPQMMNKMAPQPGMPMLMPPVQGGMMGPGMQPMFVPFFVPPNQMVMAPYYGGGEFMQPVQGFGPEMQQQMEFVPGPMQPMAMGGQPFYWPNYQA